MATNMESWSASKAANNILNDEPNPTLSWTLSWQKLGCLFYLWLILDQMHNKLNGNLNQNMFVF
jgi:hypothetical protein